MVKKDLSSIPIYKISCIAFIEDFGVHKDFKRHGIGRKLYDEAVNKAKEWNADSLELNVWEVNHEARKFYDLERLWQDGHQVNLSAVLGENA